MNIASTRLLVVVLLALSTAARGDDPAAAPATFTVVQGSTITYHLVHRFHAVTGVSREVEGKARLLPDGTAQVMVRAPLRSFDSGNANRDVHMLEATGAAANPYVVLKAVGTLERPRAYPADLDLPLHGELTLKTTRPFEVVAHVHFDGPDRVSIASAFPVSLDAHQVERPSLMFVKVDDRVDVDARLAMQADR